MNKLFLSILTMIYMTVSSGIATEIHYCMGRQSGIDYFAVADKAGCNRCGMKEKKGGCCENQHQFHKLADSHKNVYNNNNFCAPSITITAAPMPFNWQVPVSPVKAVACNNDPPDLYKPSVNIMQCVFRI